MLKISVQYCYSLLNNLSITKYGKNNSPTSISENETLLQEQRECACLLPFLLSAEQGKD
jgi:hypothetical protein